MGVKLLSISFNHDSSSATNDALNIRKNAKEFVRVPEWQPGDHRAADSPAAYSINQTRGNRLTLKARFEVDSFEPRALQIRAVRSQPANFPVLLFDQLLPLFSLWPLAYYYYFSLLTSIYGALQNGATNVLGDVRPKSIRFNRGGASRLETFELESPRLWILGVGIHDMRWHWQFRRSVLQPWTTFETTNHRIYTVLDEPKAPWQQQPYRATNTQLPWTSVLDFGCDWASSAQSIDGASSRITRRVYELGPDVIEYGCPVGAVTVYSFPVFNCSAFLERLRGGLGRGNYVNCTDCATIVSTFSNILGADLSQSQMFTPGRPFPVNPIRAIGSKSFEPPCGIGLFSYHEVAWKGNATADDSVYDACLEVDSNPPFLPFTPRLPTNMLFGRPGDRLYRDLLAAPFGRNLCEAQPSSRQRRTVI